MCLSGDMSTISDEQWKITDEAIAFYKKCAPTIKSGRNFRYGPYQESYNDLKGWQAVVRLAEDGKSLMAVVNTFAMNGETTVEFDLPGVKDVKVLKCLSDNASDVEIENFSRKGIKTEIKDGKVKIQNLSDYDGLVILVKS